MDFGTLQRGISSAEIVSDPFPFLTINRVFSRTEHEFLLRDLPSDDHYHWVDKANALRGVFPITPREVRRLDRSQRGCWASLSRLMLSEAFARLLLSRFKRLVKPEDKFSALAPQVKLVRDKPGYQLEAHTDRRATALKLVIYLRIDGPEMATNLCKPKDGAEVHEVGRWPYDRFTKVDSDPLDTGSALCFPRAVNSFHALNQGQPIDSPRDLIVYSLQWQDGSVKPGIVNRFKRFYRGNHGWPLIPLSTL